MLKNLVIENIAVIESVSIDFSENFNCMTGETGAGKSIVIDSINAVLGMKVSRDLIRTGENRAFVSAFFTDINGSVKNTIEDLGLKNEPDNTLLISRVIMRDGKNICKVNGLPATVSMLRTVGARLLNIHGQSDNLSLLSPESGYKFIDELAGNANLLLEYRETYRNLLELRSKIKKLTIDDALKERKIDLLNFQIEEIKSAGITVGEKEELLKRKNLINNKKNLSNCLEKAYLDIAGSENVSGASDLLFDAAKNLNSALEFLPEISEITSSINDIAYAIESYSSDIKNQIDNVSYDNYDINEIEERLDVIYRISKKYGSTEEEILMFLDSASKELYNITRSDEILNELKKEYGELKQSAYDSAYKLSESRKSASVVFSKRIMEELSFLDMTDTRFKVSFKETPLSDNGIDDIEFLISTNKGEDEKPLSKIASGGELSRIMLAIKCVLSQEDDIETLIFDEIDSGVSGRAAGKIAVKLSEVSKNHQVICITHLPAIASFADRHMLILKEVANDKTYTSVKELNDKERISEIARIIGGNEKDSIHLRSAELLLDEAKKQKSAFQRQGSVE